MAVTQATDPEVDTNVGPRYALDRWVELASEPAWWARSDGIGLRLRVAEAKEVAEFFDSGALTEAKTVEWIFEHCARSFAPGTYAAEHCPGAAQMADDDFMRKGKDGFGKTPITSPTAYRPNEKLWCSLVGILKQLNDTRYRDDLLENVARAAGRCGWNSKRMDELDTLVALYDAELIADGHSPSWRRAVAEAARGHWAGGGSSLPDAVRQALDEHRHERKKRSFDVWIPVEIANNPRGSSPGRPLDQSSGAGFDDVDAAAGRADLSSWGSAAGEILGHEEFMRANRFFHYVIGAADAWAAVADANEKFRQQADQWHLLDGELAEPRHAAVRDSAPGRDASVYEFPPLRLRLAPPELVDHRGRLPDIPKLADAIAQVAQARTAAETAALADLWTAVEALFSDNQHGKVDAGVWVAEALPFPYVRHISEWLGGQISLHGYGTAPVGQELEWLHRDVYADKEAVRQLFVDKDDPLGWRRLEEVFAWEDGALAKKAREIRGLYDHVTRRIYMLRNVAVHNAQQTSSTRMVTLPLFADLVRVALGQVLRYAGEEGALAEMRFACAEVNDVVARWAKGGYARDEGLKRLLFR
jgi:hypothetical protein